MTTAAALAVALALITLPSSTEGASLLAKAIRLRGCAEPLANGPPEPEGSKIIEGPDCGRVNQVIPMYQNAAEVGKLAGTARGAVIQSAAAAEAVTAAKSRAEEIGGALAKDGDLPQRIKLASDAGDEAATAATAASTALETTLETFNAKVSGSEMSGADIEASDKSELTKLTNEANAAAKTANAAAARIVAKANEAQEKAMSDTASAVKVVKGVLGKADPLLEQMPDVAQKSKFAADAAAALVTKAEEVATRIEAAVADAGAQAPVLKALKSTLDGETAGVTEQGEAVTDEIEPLNKAAAALKEKVGVLQEGADAAAGGAPVEFETAQLMAAEKAQDEAEAALSKIKAKVKTLIERQGRLKNKINEAEKKVPEKSPTA